MSAEESRGNRMEVWRKATYLLMSNIGTVLSGRILLYRNHHPAEIGATGKSRLISAYVQTPRAWKRGSRQRAGYTLRGQDGKEG
jgi:hypothetical protein